MVFMQQGMHRLPLRQGLPLCVWCFFLLIFFLICACRVRRIVWPTYAQRMADGMAQLVAPRRIPHGCGADVFFERGGRPLHTRSLQSAAGGIQQALARLQQSLGQGPIAAARLLLALHQHNEAEAAVAVIGHLRHGLRVACVSDAGTPAVSDPGARLVAAVRDAGLPVVPLPGASSVTTLLSAAGMTQEGGFVFAGFLPTKAAERGRAVSQLAAEDRAVVLLEAPHRIEALADSLPCWAIAPSPSAAS